MKGRALAIAACLAFVSINTLAATSNPVPADETCTSCAPCRDPLGKPISCTGKELGQRIDDSLVYLEELPPSSERGAEYGNKVPGSYVGPRAVLAKPEAPAAPAPLPQPVAVKVAPPPPAPPAVQPVAAPKPRSVVRMGDTPGGNQFESGKDILTAAAKARLDALVAKLQGKGNIRISVVGHTDNQRIGAGLRKRFPSNRELSEARAVAVGRYLQMGLELDDAAVTMAGKGETEPIADNKTPAGMAKNRRTEISLWYDDESPVAAVAEPAPVPAAPPTPVAPLPVAAPAPVKAEAPSAPIPAEIPAVKVHGGCGDLGPASRNGMPFRITVDGQPLETDPLMPEADRQRCVDVALDRADIELRYDPLQTKPALNVWLEQDATVAGKPINFGSYSNYLAFVERAEIRIFRKHEEPTAPPLAVLPVNWQQPTTWIPPTGTPAELQYLLRVYDRQGRFDETAVKSLQLPAVSHLHSDLEGPKRERLTGWGHDSRTVANIPVSGGTLTVNGSGIRPDQRVLALGQEAPVDATGSFALRQILPAGPQTAVVEILDPDGSRRQFSRNLTIPTNDWFYVAIGDLTVGQNRVTGPAQMMNPEQGEYDGKVYVNGRAAFYLKGKIKGEYLLTAAADTREQPVEDLFTNFSTKDPRYLLRRIDPDRYYPVYGDDSTLEEDAPTEGKFYVRLEKGDSHILWGNFQTAWTGTELTQFSRALYGANLKVRSEKTTSYGERTGKIDGFAADPGTLQSREEFRGTGGSLYYLRHMDLTRGSERLWVEVRDRDSGLVLERKQLVPVQDYDIDYLQGRVTLRSPLSAVTGSGTFIEIGSLPGNPLYLVATYEYVPGLTSVEGSTLGVSADQWLGDHLNLGVTGYRQGENSQRQKLLGTNATLRYRPGTYLRGEFAQSEGAGAGQQDSITGGFDFSTSGGVGNRAEARRVEAAVDLAELYQTGKGKGSAYWQQRGEGFSGPGQLTPGETVRQAGGRLVMPLIPSLEAELKGDDRRSLCEEATSLEGVVRWQVASEWQVGAGVRHDERWRAAPNASEILSATGDRTDVQLRLSYKPLITVEGAGEARPAGWDLYGYAQETVNKNGNRRDNDRLGVGGSWQLTDRFRLTGEGSGGTGGGGGLIGGDYRISDRSNLYLTYTSEVERADVNSRGRYSTTVVGSRSRVTDQMAIYGETKSTHGAGPESLVHAFGLDLSPNDRWTYGFKGEQGTVSDPTAGDLERWGAGLTAAYKYERTSYGGGLEFRDERGASGSRQVWLVRNSLSYQATAAWRLFGKANFSLSRNSGGSFYDGDFVELVTGGAYRPVNNDRWNTLFKYTYFRDLPSPGQVTAENLVADYSQQSHVLSADAIYDLYSWLSIGGKIGWRESLLRDNRIGGDWFTSQAYLGILRGDFHLTRRWDIMGEGRTLMATEAKGTRSGFLAASYYHLNKHVKAGVGYNFTDFSDDLTDLSYRSQGWFINVIGSM